ncbi:MAG: SDR family oxidoreductase [Cyclobacteriaceae bacterium]|nr:SDR family oxidoreductase [Cyclobacteriaceae bacterium]
MNKLAVVTGGTKGIGRAIIERFAAAGFDIATCARKEADLNEIKSAIESNHPVKVTAFIANMSNKDHIQKFAEKVKQLQPVEVLVNNAGYFIPGSVLDEADGALESMINTNLFSAYHLSRLLVPAMRARKSGHVFNMCSIASIMAYPNGGSYAISKFALLGFSKVLREELKAHGVRVTSVLPGATLTASWDGVDLPDERLMKPEDVAETIFSAYSLSKRSVVEEILIRPQLGDL